MKWAAPSEFVTYRLCEQRRFRRACASAQSRQNLRCSLIQAVSQEEPSDRKPDPWSLWMDGHAQLKFVMTECSKTQIRLTRPKWSLSLNISISFAFTPSVVAQNAGLPPVYSDQESEIGVWLKPFVDLLCFAIFVDVLCFAAQEDEDCFALDIIPKCQKLLSKQVPCHKQDIITKWVGENDSMPSTGIQSANRRIRAARVLTFPLLPHDFQT